MFKWIRKFIWPSKGEPVGGKAADQAPTTAPRKRPARPESERVLMASLEQNSVAPSEDVMQHAYDLYQEEVFAPFLDRRHRMAGLHADIAATMSTLQALVPGLIQQAVSRHPFEFSHIIEHKESER